MIPTGNFYTCTVYTLEILYNSSANFFIMGGASSDTS